MPIKDAQGAGECGGDGGDDTDNPFTRAISKPPPYNPRDDRGAYRALIALLRQEGRIHG